MSGEVDADVIVVGSGLLGAFAAEHLARRGKSVLMLEAGPRVRRFELLDRFRHAPSKGGDTFYPEQSWAPKSGGGRYSEQYLESVGPVPWKPSVLRLVGGTTWHWSSAFWRYLPSDFKLASTYGQGRDWPISYEDLEPWYAQAEQIAGCAGSDTDDQSGRQSGPFPPRSSPYPLPPEPVSSYTRHVAERLGQAGFAYTEEPHLRATRPYQGRPTCCGNNNCAPLCPIGAMFSGDMAVDRAERAGVQVIPEAVAYRLEEGAKHRIVAVHTMTPEGLSTRRTARYVVLAAHAIETPKLLLLSGLANSSDQVGRNLMSHPSCIYEVLVRDPVWPGRGPTQQGAWCGRREGEHRKRHSGYKFHANQQTPNAMLTERLLKAGVIGRALDEGIRHDASRFVSLIAALEMLPTPSNRITLGTHKDSLGLPAPRIYFDHDDYARAGARAVQGDFDRFDLAFKVETKLGDRSAVRPAAHIMGSTIMGDSPKNSVVDGDCRTYDHSNLFIASSSVFPSSSVVNPTLTGAALALRLADRIASEI